jgi:hypothetical protein
MNIVKPNIKQIEGIHFSSKILNVNDTIISKQHLGRTYKLVWDVYKQVAEELNKFLPYEFGYAYPINKNIDKFSRMNKYLVTSDDVTIGNFNYSIYLTMDMLGSLVDRSLPLKDRLIKRDILIRERAFNYFTKINDVDEIELISNEWKVIKKL